MPPLHLFHAPRRRLQLSMPSILNSLFHPPPRLLTPQTVPSLRYAAPFSTTSQLLAKAKLQQKRDMRVVLIRYHLKHPRAPRPLRFSRMRALRHWTIHRAWQLYQAKRRRARELQLERQYSSMRDACEALRLMGEHGLAVAEGPLRPGGTEYVRKADGTGGPPMGARSAREAEAAERQTDVGKLYRTAMSKEGVWQGVPIEYARLQTETPSRDGWNHGWKRE